MYRKIETRLTAPICAVLIFTIGLACLAFFPIGRSADAWTHTYRVSGILNGDVIARPVDSLSAYHCVPGESWGGSVSNDIVELSIECTTTRDPGIVIPETITVRTADTSDVVYNNTAVYSPIAYIPQLVGFSIGKAIGLSAAFQYYLAELCMLLVWTLFCTLAIMGLPKYRLAMLILVLFPAISLPNAFAVSTDGMLLACTILFSCYVYRCMLQKPTLADYLILSVAGFLLVNVKFSFAPLLFLILFPPIKWRDVKGRGAIPIAALAISALSVFVWMKMGATGFPTSPALVSSAELAERNSGIFVNLGELFSHIWWSVSHFEASYTFGTQGVASFWIVFACMLVVLILIALRHRSVEPSIAFWFAVWVVILLTVLVMYTALYLQYNLAGSPGVMGIQYRYFLPYLPLALLMALDCIPAAFSKRTSAA